MNIFDIFEETYSALSSNKARSGLTVLGIVIGISSVIAMLSIGQGAQSSIESSVESIGSNMISIMPGVQRGAGMMVSGGRGSAKSLTLDDAEAIASEISNIDQVSAEVSGRYQVTAKGTNTNTQVMGSTQAYAAVHNVSIEEGEFIREQDNASGNKVAVLGPSVAEDLFGEEATDIIGQTIRIKQLNFKVVGITKSKGGTGFGSADDMIFIPLSTAQRYFSGDKYLTGISVAAATSEAMDQVQQDITDLLLERHNKASDNADFNVLNQADIAATAGSIAQVFTILLGSVAGISLIVGGIGIMNMMLTNVTERTREIGLRKAIGAKGSDISKQFLVESIVLTFLGGLIGIVLGWLVAYGLSAFGLIQTSVSLFSVLLAFGVSALIGIVFGYYPARRAAGLNPIDALRFE